MICRGRRDKSILCYIQNRTDGRRENYLEVELLLWRLSRWRVGEEVKIHRVHTAVERVRGF